MSLAFRIVAVIALLGTALALELAGESLISWHTAMRAGETARIAARSEALQEAAAALAVERGLVNGALSAPGTTTPGTTTPGTTTPGTAAPGTAAPGTIAPGAITPAQRAAIAAQRDRATSELNRALSGLETLDGLDAAAIAPLQESLRGSRARVDGLRAAIDGGGMPAPAAWFATATAQIDAVIALRRRLDAVSNEENDVTRLIAVRDALSDMAEFTGRERGRVNGMIAARTRLTPADFLELGTLRGRVETAWARVQSRLDVMPAAAVAPARAAGAALFEQFEAVRRPVLAAAQRGADPPVSAEQWFAAATGAIDAMRSAQVAAGTTLDAVMHERARLGWRHLALTLTLWAATLAAGLLAMWYVLFRVVRPLNRAIAAMHGLSEGALDIAVPPARGHDEIARLLRATAHFQETALAHRSLEDRQAALQRDSERSRVDAIHEVGALIERESELAVRNVTGLAEQVAEISGDVGRDVAAITAAARMAAELAAGGRHESDAAAGAAHGLNDAIQEIARQMETTTSTTRDVVAHTVETRASFDALFASVAEVQEVARLIGSIAARTNLLALNATIEAARAGEAGKGFAVVATEVKQLAHQTAQSTEQISARVGAIDVAARHAQQALDGIVKAVNGLDAIAAQVAAAVEQQSAATGQIAEAVQSASTAAGRTADQVTAVTDVAARCAEAVTATQAVSAQAVERISGLQTALMGILRSRVAELDRRAGVREAVALPARLLHGGGAVAGELRDLSPGGAQFEGDAPALTTARLQVAGLPEIAVRVAHRDGRLVNLAFEFTDATQRQAMADAVAALLASATVAHAA